MLHPSRIDGPFRAAFTLAELTDLAARWHPQESLIVARTDRCIADIFAGLWGSP